MALHHASSLHHLCLCCRRRFILELSFGLAEACRRFGGVAEADLHEELVHALLILIAQLLEGVEVLRGLVSFESFDELLQENDELVHFIHECRLDDGLLVLAYLKALHLFILSLLLPLHRVLEALDVADDLVKLGLRLLELILLLLDVLQPLIIHCELVLEHTDLCEQLRHFLVDDALLLLLESRHVVHVLLLQVLDVQQLKHAQLLMLALLLALQDLSLQVRHLGLVLLALFNAPNHFSDSIKVALERLENIVCQLLDLRVLRVLLELLA